MKEYFYLIKASLKKSLAYRWNLVIGLVSRLFLFLVLSRLWQTIYRDDPETTTHLVTYSLLSVLYAGTIDLRLGRYISDDIKFGDLTPLLMKPINTITLYFFSNIGEAIINTGISTVIFFTVQRLNPFVKLQLLFSPLHILACVLAGVFGFILYSQFYILGSTLTFWLNDSKFFHIFVSRFVKFLGGGSIPISIFFPLLEKIARLLPFSLAIYLPVSLLINLSQYPTPFTEVIKQLAWIVVLGILIRIIWHKGLLKYEAQGQ
jgi:ABC-2 type transport system permease protein